MILVFGTSGQVATELQKSKKTVTLSRHDADLSDTKACYDLVRLYKPKAVINAAAFTDVNKAEENEILATVINGEAPTAIANACVELNIPIVQISTDYVFSGFGAKPWSPYDVTQPKNAYGRSKLVGEKGVRDRGATHAILRISWVISPHGKNFLKTILKQAEIYKIINVVSDQIGGPTPAHYLASACISIAEKLQKNHLKSGTYHFSGGPDVSWAELATVILKKANLNRKINKILTSEYKTLATRPLNSRLECSKTSQVFGINRPCWQASLDRILLELKET